VATSHRDPTKLDRVRRRRANHSPSLAHGPGKVVRTGESELITDIDDALLQAAAKDGEAKVDDGDNV
jgi:hypothetical protein